MSYFPSLVSMTDNLKEDRRNALLRRVDWRFLLPQPIPEKTVCFAGGMLGDAVALISRRMVQAQAIDAQDCDLAVAENPGQEIIDQALAHLKPGGSLYIELRPGPILGAKPILRRLEQAGFEGILCYRPWPSLQAPALWAPTNSLAVQRYLLSSRGSARTLFRRCKDALRRCKRLVDFRLSRKLPVCVIARKPPSTSALGLREIIRGGWSGWKLGRLPDRVSELLITEGSRTISKVVRLIFEEPRPEPLLAVKMARVPESALALAKEAALLDAVHSGFDDAIEGIPRVLFKTDLQGTCIIGETAFSGVPLFSQLERRNYRCLALKITDWSLVMAGRPLPRAQKVWWDRLIKPVLADFERSFARVAAPGSLAMTEQVISRVGALPLVCEQRDFSPWNILLTAKGNLAVLDWESAELEGLPALDLIYCLTYLAFFFDHASDDRGYRRSYRTALDQTTFTGAIHAECFERYARALNLSMSNLHSLRLLTWMVHSRSEYQRLVADVNDEPAAEVLRRSLFFTLWKEELEHAEAACCPAEKNA
jgi:hypothetical protein